MIKPKIRFKGYQEEWEQRKLGDMAEFSKGSGYSKGDLIESGTPIILYGRLYTKYETIISDVDTFVEAKDGSVYSKGGEVIVPASGETAEDIARAASVDKSGILLGGDLNVVMPNEDINSAFLAISISNGSLQRELARKAQGKSVVHIHNEEIRNLIVPFPTKAEQNKMENYFAALDHFITLHHRKCEETKILKKYMLQKMFPQNGNSVPEIRFWGFTEDWEQRKLGEVIEGVSKKNTDGLYTQDDILACSLGTELDRKTIFYGLRSTEDSVKSYRIVNIGNVIYTKSPIKGYPNGIVRTCKIVDGIVPSLYCVYKKKENISIPIDTRFIQSYLEDKGRLAQYLCPLVNVGARNNVNITDKEFLEGVIKIPMTVEEQTKIVDALEKINHLITLHHRKSNIFIREWDFVWEQRKLIDVCDYVDYRGKTPIKTDSGVFLVTAKNVKDGYIDYGASQEYISEDDYEEVMHRGKPEIGDVLITTEAPCGNVAQVNRADIALAQRIIKYRGQSNIVDNTYLKYYLLSPEFQNILNAKSSGGTVKGIKGSILHQQEIKYPKYEEQFKIGSYFNNLDHLITLHHRKQICVQMG